MRCFQRSKAISFALFGLISQHAFAYDLLPLWESYLGVSGSTQVHDSVYTTYLNDHRNTTAGGVWGPKYDDHWVAAWMPCSDSNKTGPSGEAPYHDPTGTDVTHGYYSFAGANTHFPCLQPTGAVAVYRLYKGAPQYDHVLVTAPSEVNSLEAAGYSFDRVEGYVFTSQVTSSTPLYRLSWHANLTNTDVEHRYTVSTVSRQMLINNGWADEGIMGYVFSSPPTQTVQAVGWNGQFNDKVVNPSTPVTVDIRPVGTAVTAQIPTGAYNLYGFEAFSMATVRPSRGVWQSMSFQLDTGDMFSPSSSLDHFPFYLRHQDTPVLNSVFGAPGYDGIALVLSATGTTADGGGACAPAAAGEGQLFFELGNGKSFTTHELSCAPRLTTNLLNNSRYLINYQLDDSANVKITITKFNIVTGTWDPQSFVGGATTYTASLISNYSCPSTPTTANLTPATAYCTNPESPQHFPNTNTGYGLQAFYDDFPTGTHYTQVISNFQVHWLNAVGTILN